MCVDMKCELVLMAIVVVTPVCLRDKTALASVVVWVPRVAVVGDSEVGPDGTICATIFTLSSLN